MRIYLSSTLNDLESERRAVKDALSSLHAIVESYDADERSVRESCLADVATCELYVGIVGLRYGFVPPGESKSITELEFDAATGMGIPRLIFLKDPARVAATMSDSFTREHEPERIDTFRHRLDSGESGIPRPAYFGTCDELKERLLRALLRAQDGLAPPGAAESVPDPVEPASGTSAPPSGMTELQAILWRYLSENWQRIHADSLFLKAEVVGHCPKPLTARGVFDTVTTGDCEDVLVGLRSCFNDSNPTPRGSPTPDRSSCAFQALTYIALVAAEKFVLDERERIDLLRGEPHEPIPGQDPVLAAVVAAAVFRFGLRFRPDNRLPVNVLYSELPQAELGNPGEEGPGLVRQELLAMANRLDTGSEFELAGTEMVSERLLKRLLERIAKQFGCPIALAAGASGAMATAEARIRLVEDMERVGVPVFFRLSSQTQLPDSVRSLLADLKTLLAPFFHSESIHTPSENLTMSKTESPSPNPAVVNNFTFHAPVGAVAQANAPGAVAAGRDVVQGLQAPDLATLLAELSQALVSHPVLIGEPAKQQLFTEYVKDIEGVVNQQKDQPTASEARLVKRCLEGLKDGAEAIENGNKIVEKLSPLWDGMKTAWPAVAAILT